MAVDPLLDPNLPSAEQLPDRSLWRKSSFRRLWTAATVSIFGSLVTRMALAFVAILTLGELVCTLGAGFLALYIGLRATSFLAPLGGLLAAALVWNSSAGCARSRRAAAVGLPERP